MLSLLWDVFAAAVCLLIWIVIAVVVFDEYTNDCILGCQSHVAVSNAEVRANQSYPPQEFPGPVGLMQ